MMKDANGIVWTPTGLIRWPSLFVPSLPKGADPGKTPQYSAMLILSGNEPNYAAFRDEIIAELDRACIDKHGSTVEEMRQRGRFKVAVKANNDPDAGKLSMGGFKERPNGIHFNATTQFMPPVMDANNMGMSKDREAELYDGIFGQIGVTAWGWAHPTGGKGISLNLHGAVKRFDGEKLGGAQADMSNVPQDDYVPDGAKTVEAETGGMGGGGGEQQQQQSGGGDQTPQGGGAGFGF